MSEITLNSLPKTLDELKAMPQAALTVPEEVAALTVAALALYPENPAEAEKILDFLRGPRPLNGIDKQFIRDRFRGKEYLMRSYLVGSTPENNYTPVQPYRVTVSENTYSRTQFVDGYLTLYVACSGAVSPRPLKLRNKPSTGQWFRHMLLVYSLLRFHPIYPTHQMPPWAGVHPVHIPAPAGVNTLRVTSRTSEPTSSPFSFQ